MKRDKENRIEDAVWKLRIVQGLGVGVLTLGMSMSVGDISTAWEYPISSLSITTTMFGLMGTLMTEFMIRRLKKDEK